MPTTVGSAVLFVCLLLPGMAYVARIERGQRPGKSSAVSAFRETVAVFIASVVALGLAGALFAAARSLWPHDSPDVGRLVRNGHASYERADYAYLAEWAIAVLLAAVVFAYLGAVFDVVKLLDRFVSGGSGSSTESAWWKVFELKSQATQNKYLVCRLQDGTEIEGALWSYANGADEVDDRQIVITGPYFVRSSSGVERRYDAGCVVVTARDISLLHVDYLDDAMYERFISREAATQSDEQSADATP